MSSIQGIMRSKVQGWDPWKSLKRNPSSWSLCGIAKSIYVSYNPLFLPSATLRDQMRRENSSSFAHSENMAGTWKSTIWKSGKSSKKTSPWLWGSKCYFWGVETYLQKHLETCAGILRHTWLMFLFSVPSLRDSIFFRSFKPVCRCVSSKWCQGANIHKMPHQAHGYDPWELANCHCTGCLGDRTPLDNLIWLLRVQDI